MTNSRLKFVRLRVNTFIFRQNVTSSPTNVICLQIQLVVSHISIFCSIIKKFPIDQYVYVQFRCFIDMTYEIQVFLSLTVTHRRKTEGIIRDTFEINLE